MANGCYVRVLRVVRARSGLRGARVPSTRVRCGVSCARVITRARVCGCVRVLMRVCTLIGAVACVVHA